MDNFLPDMSEKLQRFLDGDLSETEKEEIEAQLKQDAALQEELENLRLAREATKYYGLTRQVAGLHKEAMQELKQKAPVIRMNVRRRIIRYSLSAAAAVLLLFAGFRTYEFISVGSKSVYNSHFISYELNTGRGDSTADSPIEKAYREKNYSLVIDLTGKTGGPGSKTLFLAGMSSLEMGNAVKAIDFFKKVIGQENGSSSGIMRDESEYYLALAYIKNRNYPEVLNLLEKIKSDPQHIYHKKITGRFIREVRMLKWKS